MPDVRPTDHRATPDEVAAKRVELQVLAEMQYLLGRFALRVTE